MCGFHSLCSPYHWLTATKMWKLKTFFYKNKWVRASQDPHIHSSGPWVSPVIIILRVTFLCAMTGFYEPLQQTLPESQISLGDLKHQAECTADTSHLTWYISAICFTFISLPHHSTYYLGRVKVAGVSIVVFSCFSSCSGAYPSRKFGQFAWCARHL